MFFLAIWASISHELIRFEKKQTLVLTVPYCLGELPTKIAEKVMVVAQILLVHMKLSPKQFKKCFFILVMTILK